MLKKAAPKLMFSSLRSYLDKYVSHPEALFLVVFASILGFIFHGLGNVLAPVLLSMILAYCLDSCAKVLTQFNIDRRVAVSLAFSGYLSLFILSLFVIFPILWKQGQSLFEDLPLMMNVLKSNFQDRLSEEALAQLSTTLTQNLESFGTAILSFSWSSISSAITWTVYLVLMPVMIFFMLKDKVEILKWFSQFLPRKRPILSKILTDLNMQITQYIRGKVIEMLLIGVVSYIAFWFVGLKYNALLSFLIGFSAIIPFVGTLAVTCPLFLAAFLQYGWGSAFIYVVVVHSLIQLIDGNILVPILFAEVLNLHPLAILIAILIFGGIWGVWGIFFAIPLAILIKILIHYWPTRIR